MTELFDRIATIRAVKQEIQHYKLDDGDAPALALIYGQTLLLIVPGQPDHVLGEVDISLQVFHAGDVAPDEDGVVLRVHTLRR